MALKPDPRHTRQTPLTRAKGVGASGSGTGHWIEQQLLSVFMIPLGLYALVTFFCSVLLGNGYEDAVTWLRFPPNTLALLLMIAAGTRHGTNGVISSVEDYVHHGGWNIALTLLVKFIGIMVVGVSFLAVLTVYVRA